MKRKLEFFELAPVKTLRQFGSAKRYFPVSAEALKNISSALCSLMIAAQTGSTDIVKFHIENSSKDFFDVSFGPLRRNLLHLAAVSGNEELIDYLISNKIANLFGIDELNNLPINLASGKCKKIIKKQMNWTQTKGLIFCYKFCDKIKLPANIIRQICQDFIFCV